MLKDPETYGKDADDFNPERFLKRDGSGELDPEVPNPDVAFGFSRRQCPGRNFAWATLWHTVASILACFEITASDEGIKEHFTEGLAM
jgi:cytochrome P450